MVPGLSGIVFDEFLTKYKLNKIICLFGIFFIFSILLCIFYMFIDLSMGDGAKFYVKLPLLAF